MTITVWDSSDNHYKEYDTDDIEIDGHTLSEHDAQVRAEAIDEFVENADAEIYKDFNRTDVGEYTIADVALTIRRVAEQLKEQIGE